MAIYVVTDTSSKEGKQHLVKAKTKASALSAIVEPQFTVVPADDSDIIRLTKAGVELVEAK